MNERALEALFGVEALRREEAARLDTAASFTLGTANSIFHSCFSQRAIVFEAFP